MKNKLKKEIKIGFLIFGFITFLTNCEHDNFNQEHANRQAPESPPFITTNLSINEVQQNQKVISILNGLNEGIKNIKSNESNKEVYSSIYDFIIDTDYVTYIENEDGSYHSYTFPIFRTNSNGFTENLLLSFQPDGSYRVFIVSYDLTSLDKDSLLNGEEINLDDKTTFTEIDGTDLITDIFSKEYACGFNTELICYETPCEIDGCWEPQWTGIECDSFVFFVECSGGASGVTTLGDESVSGGTSGVGASSGGNGSEIPNIDVTIPTIQPWESISICINGINEMGATDNTLLTPEMTSWLQTQPKSIVDTINSFLHVNDCNESSQELIIEYIENQLSFPYPHCSSFEFAQPFGENVRACAVTDLGDSFYAMAVNPDLSGGFYNIEINYPIIYFTMPTWMTNGEAATKTAEAVNLAFEDTIEWYQENPTVEDFVLGIQLDLFLQTRMNAIGGTWTLTPPFNIPSPAPFVTSIWGTGNCN